jgi:hypothetical protein
MSARVHHWIHIDLLRPSDNASLLMYRSTGSSDVDESIILGGERLYREMEMWTHCLKCLTTASSTNRYAPGSLLRTEITALLTSRSRSAPTACVNSFLFNAGRGLTSRINTLCIFPSFPAHHWWIELKEPQFDSTGCDGYIESFDNLGNLLTRQTYVVDRISQDMNLVEWDFVQPGFSSV